MFCSYFRIHHSDRSNIIVLQFCTLIVHRQPGPTSGSVVSGMRGSSRLPRYVGLSIFIFFRHRWSSFQILFHFFFFSILSSLRKIRFCLNYYIDFSVTREIRHGTPNDKATHRSPSNEKRIVGKDFATLPAKETCVLRVFFLLFEKS